MRWALVAVLLAGCAQAQPQRPDAASPTPARGDRRHVLTHLPVDLAPLFAPPLRQDRIPIRPFFEYTNTHHAEGPRKWYLYAWERGTQPVVCPATAVFVLDELRRSRKTKTTTLGGVDALLDVQVRLRVTEDITVFFMHLALRAEIVARARAAGGRLTLKAGEPLGWIHNPPWNSLDFGVEDRRAPSGMTRDAGYWWNVRANPLDYFVPALRARILRQYAPVAKQLRAWGSEPYVDLANSRSNVLEPGTLWGVWFLDALDQPLRRHRVNWAIINVAPRRWLDAAGMARELAAHPKMSGLLTENGQGEQVGPPLYPGERPIGHGRLTILSGDARAGTGRYQARFNDDKRQVWLRWAVTRGAARQGWDDTLRLQGYATRAALAGGWKRPLRFRRSP